MAIAITFVENPTVDTSETWQCTDSVWASGFELWIEVGFRSPASVNALQTSPDKTIWTMQALPTNATRRAVAYSPTLNRAVTVGSGVADWSDDGITWAAATVLPEANNWWDVDWDVTNEVFIAVASTGANRVMTSADGKTWTAVAAAAAKGWQGLVVSPTVAIAVAFSSSTNTQLVMTSGDGGANWSLITHTAIATNRGLVGGAGRLNIGYSSDLDQFLITGTDAGGVTKAWRSTDDGATWTASNVIPTISDTTARGYFWLSAVQSWYMSCSNLNYGESTDGVTWTVTTFTDPPVSNAGYTPMGWDNDSAILLGGSTLGFDTVLVGQVTELGAVSPSRGTKRGGTVITITGLGLSGVSQDDVLIGGSVALSVSAAADGTSVTCITPAHAVGLVDVEITGIGTLEDAFTYVSVDSVHPRNGPTTGVQAVTIRGFGFDLAGVVTFSGIAATNVVVVNNTTITCTTPAHSSGLVDIYVAEPDLTLIDIGFGLYTYQIGLDKLPPIPYQVPPVEQIEQRLRREWVQWFQTAKVRIETPVTITPEQITGGEALTAVDDTNVTLTLTGTPESALLEAVTATLGWTGRLAASRGGTGIGTYAVGDLLYANTTVTLARLADVAAGSYLRSGGVGVAPVWSTLTLPNAATTGDLLYASAANTISNLAAVAAGRVLRAAGVSTAPAYSTFTIPDTFAQGDLIYGSAANTLTALAKDTNATRYLSNTGASNNPAWAQVDLTNGVTGVLPVANGGTGTSTAFTEGSVVFAGPSGTFAQDNANFFWNDTTNALTLGGALNVGGLVTVTGTGTHSFSGAGVSNVLSVGNSTAGTSNFSRFILANDLGSRGFFTLLSSTFTSAGINTADGIALVCTGTGGSTFGSTNAAGTTRLYALGVQQLNLGAVTTQRLGGAGTGANQVQSINSTAGTTNLAGFSCVTDQGVNRFNITAFSSTWTVVDDINLADGMTLFSGGVGGLTFGASDASGGNVRFFAGGVVASTDLVATFSVSQNILIAGATAPSSGTAGIVFPDGTALASMASNTAGLFANDVGGTVHMFAIAEDGVTIQLTGAATNTLAAAVQGNITTVGALNSGSITSGFGAIDIGTDSVTAGAAILSDKVTKYANVTTAGWGVPAIYGSGRSTAQTAAVASVVTYTVGAADGSFLVSANVNVTTSTTHNFTAAVDYTDETNTARTLTLSFSQLAGTIVTAITNGTGAGPYHGVPLHIRCKTATAITIKTVGSFTTVTYSVEGAIQQVA